MRDLFNRLIGRNTPRVVVDEAGTVKYYNAKGELHRDDGPAKLFKGGAMLWYRNGKLHRTDGPAIEDSTLDDKGCWFVDGVELSERDIRWLKDKLNGAGGNSPPYPAR